VRTASAIKPTSEEQQVELLKLLADKLGYRITKKPTRKR